MCKITFSLLSDGEMMQRERESQVVDDRRKSALVVIQSRVERLIGDTAKALRE